MYPNECYPSQSDGIDSSQTHQVNVLNVFFNI